jgi:hypothetical protein
MMRLLHLRRQKQSHSRTSACPSASSLEKPADLSHTTQDEEDSFGSEDDISLSSSSSRLCDEQNPAVMYKSHTFQQRVHAEQHQSADKAEAFVGFMQRAAALLSPALNGNDNPVWWDFERDYDENDENECDDPCEDLPTLHSDSHPFDFAGMMTMSRGSDLSVHSASADPLDECSQAHLLAQSAILKAQHAQGIGEHKPSSGENKHLLSALEVPYEEINFEPRVDDKSEDYEHSSFFPERAQNKNHFVQETSPRDPEPEIAANHCFSNIQLLPPEYFDTLREATLLERMSQKHHEQQPPHIKVFRHSEQEEEYCALRLSGMVHSLDPTLFEKDASSTSSSMISIFDTSVDTNNSSKAPIVIREGGLSVVEYKFQRNSSVLDTIRKRFASNFRSKAKGAPKQVIYSLGKGRTLSEEDQKYAKSLLPPKQLLSSKVRRGASSDGIPRSLPSIHSRALSVLLVNSVLKIFEIVLVDILNDTTVGDVLSKARAYATDHVLGGQKYMSLCNLRQEIAAPMLPVSLLVASWKMAGRHAKLADQDEARRVDEDNRREMEARLLVAVPEGSTATECQMIRRMLWQNPKVQRWWRQSDPFRHPDDIEKEEDIPHRVSCPHAAQSQQHRNPANRRVKYQKL